MSWTAAQKLRCWAAYLANQSNPNFDEVAALFAAAETHQLREILEDWFKAWNALSMLRLLARKELLSSTPSSLPSLEEIRCEGNQVFRSETCIGELKRLFKPMLPVDWQARLAYETFLDRFFTYLEGKRKAVVLAETDDQVELFIPQNTQTEVQREWSEFVQHAYSREELLRTFVLVLNSVDLGEAFHDLLVPIVSRDQAELIAAFFYAFKRRFKDLDRNKHKEGLRAFEQVSSKLKKDQKAKLEQLATFFTNQALQNLMARSDSEKRRFERIPKLLDPDRIYDIPPLIMENTQMTVRRPGDFDSDICYVCGTFLPRQTKRPKKEQDWFEANKFIIQSPSQALQSTTSISQREPRVCPTCAALSITSPIKLTGASFVLALKRREGDRYLLEHHLRMLMLGELNLTAGRYALIACTEKVKVGNKNKPMFEQLGGREYALYKAASLFPADVFPQYEVEAIVGTAKLTLPSRHLWVLNRLIALLDGVRLVPERVAHSKEDFSMMSEVIRHVERDRLIFAIYRLVQARKGGHPHSPAEARRLEDLLKGYAAWLAKGGEIDMGKAQRLRDIAGLTGILSAFVGNAKRVLREKSRSPEEIRRELGKLIEKSDDPNHFCYVAAQNSESNTALLFQNTDTHFVYEEAARLLREIGVDPQSREGEAAKMLDSEQKALLLTFDDVKKVFCRLFESTYKTDKDQREITYELKLSLYARFPEAIPGGK